MTAAADGEMPKLGFGVGTSWFKGPAANEESGGLSLNTSLVDSVNTALDSGFKLLDCAEVYGTDKECGKALEGRDRTAIWITSKLQMNRMNAEQALDAILKRLGTKYLDLLLSHSPFDIDVIQQWKLMENLVKTGKVKRIGLSNYRVEDLELILSSCTIKPYCNQIEFNPYLQQPDLVSFMVKNDIKLVAYSPLISLTHAKGGPLDEVVSSIAKKHNSNESNVLLTWALQQGHYCITTSSKPARMKQVLELNGSNPLKLDKKDMDLIRVTGSKKNFRKYWQDRFPSTA